MKKRVLILSLLVFSLAAAGCSKKTEETTAAASAAETTAEEKTEEGEEIEENSLSGSITAVDGNVITVKSDGDEGEVRFDISEADVINQFDLTEGDTVYVEYYAEDKNPLTAILFEVEDSVLAANTDPSAEGKVVETGESTITFEIDGEDWTFATGNAYIVANNGVKNGESAVVTYIGDLDDEPMAVKIVMSDSSDTADARKNAFTGKVAEVDEENGCIVLTSDNDDFFTFVTEDDLEGYTEGQTVQIFYEGSIASKAIKALEIVAK